MSSGPTPVDTDPAHWLSTRLLLGLTAALLLGLLLTVVLAVVLWHTPGMAPIAVPTGQPG